MTDKKDVFISYSTQDQEAKDELVKIFDENDISYWLDEISLDKIGENLNENIEEGLRETRFTVFLVSENSLKSMWVTKEAVFRLMQEDFHKSNAMLPVLFDKKAFDNDFLFEVYDKLEEQLNKEEESREKAKKRKMNTEVFDLKINRLQKTLPQITDIFKKIREGLSASFFDEKKKEADIQKLIRTIKGDKNIPTHYEQNNSNLKTQNTMIQVPEFFTNKIKKQIRDEYEMIADANLRRSITRNPNKKQEYTDIIDGCEESIRFSTERFIKRAKEEYKVSENEATILIQEMKKEIQKQLGVQNKKLDAILVKIDETQEKLLNEMLDSANQVSEEEANKLIGTLMERIDALSDKIPNSEEIKNELKHENSISSKFKLTIPIIPTILSYEADFGEQWVDSVPLNWQNPINKIKESLKGKKNKA